MPRISYLLILLAVLGCSKDKFTCEDNRNALQQTDTDKVKTFIELHIASLPSPDYNEANINQLAASISNECGFAAAVNCFDCIKTLTSQTEIVVSFNTGGGTLQRTIDLSYSSSNKIVFRSVHN